MIGLIFCVVGFLVVMFLALWLPYDGEGKVLAGVSTFFIGGLFWFLIALALVPLTGGLMPNYSIGERNGYLTKISTRGVVFKTIECEMQIGTGQQAALQEPFYFSVTNDSLKTELQSIASKNHRIKIEYREWFCMPYWVGSSGYELLKVSFDD